MERLARLRRCCRWVPAGVLAGAAFLSSLAQSGPGSIVRVSTTAGGVGANGYSESAVISADGRYVAFMSMASNLDPSDTSTGFDIFRKDLQTGALVRASTSATGGQSNPDSSSPSISADGRYVAFESFAENLVAGDPTESSHIFRKDVQTGAVVRVSASGAGIQADESSQAPVISADGRYVVFGSFATNLVEGDTDGSYRLYRKDLQSGGIRRVIENAQGQDGGSGTHAAISPDGRYVAFVSSATNLVPGDSNGVDHVYRKDFRTGAVVRVSTGASGLQADSYCWKPSISADGRYIAFHSNASNLVPEPDWMHHVFRKDLQTGAVAVVSANAAGERGNWASDDAKISADGRYVVFHSDATNLVPGDTNDRPELFCKDLQTGLVTRVCTATSGAEGNDWSQRASASADGRYVAFESPASNLVSGDTNGTSDVFCRDLGAQFAQPKVRSLVISPSLGSRPKGMWVTARFDRMPTGRLIMTVDTPNSWLVPPGPVGVSGRTTSVRFFVGMARSPLHGEKITIRTWLLGIPFSTSYRFR